MGTTGWYYLHTNGSLIYKREIDGGTAADIRESDFARAMWPFDPQDREQAWITLIEVSALGADPARIKELATHWGCDDTDADTYNRLGPGLDITRDGNKWCALPHGGSMPKSPVGFGDTKLEAMAELCKALGYRGGKTWNATFSSLLAALSTTEAAR